MGLPNVKVDLLNGQLGSVTTTDDGVAGLVLSCITGTDKIGLNDPKVISSVKDLTSLGLDEDMYSFIYKEVKAFYRQAGEGSELWITLYHRDTTLTDLCDPAQQDNVIKKLIDAAGGRIKLLGINRLPDPSYTPVTTTGIDIDVITAIANLQSLADEYVTKIRPFRALLPGAYWTGDVNNLANLTELSSNRVSVVLSSDDPENKTASIGLALGRLASIPVHRNIGRVKDGSVTTQAWLTDGSEATAKEGVWNILHDYGYVFLRKYQGKTGFYFNYDHTCSPVSDDYHQISIGRVIDKAIVLAYSTYIEELLDSVEIDDDGKLNPAVCSYFENKIENAVNANMSGEISSFNAYVNPQQNILSNGKLTIVCSIIPVGTLKEIVVELGLTNPSLT